jgi:hypothetical protein
MHGAKAHPNDRTRSMWATHLDLANQSVLSNVHGDHSAAMLSACCNAHDTYRLPGIPLAVLASLRNREVPSRTRMRLCTNLNKNELRSQEAAFRPLFVCFDAMSTWWRQDVPPLEHLAATSRPIDARMTNSWITADSLKQTTHRRQQDTDTNGTFVGTQGQLG